MLPDIRSRARTASHELRILRRGLLKFTEVPLHVRCGAARLAIASAFEFNCAIWPRLNQTESNAFQAARVFTLRAATGLYSRDGDNYTQSDVVAAADALHGDVARRIARLRYLPRMVRIGAAVLLAIIASEAGTSGSWGEMLYDDLEWLKRTLSQLSTYPWPRDNLAVWVKASLERPQAWKSWTKKATIQQAAGREGASQR